MIVVCEMHGAFIVWNLLQDTSTASTSIAYVKAICMKVESVCQNCVMGRCANLHIHILLQVRRSSHTPKANLTKGELKALVELGKDSNWTMLTADKGVAMVVMGRREYIDKVNNLPVQAAYRAIDRDPTNKQKTKHITILRRIKGNQA